MNKAFQLITWKIEDNNTKVEIQSVIYNYCELINNLGNEGYPIVIGLNPSNTTIFNEDETNLYLRNKIKTEWKVNGYILTNLCTKIESDSNNIKKEDFDETHIENIMKLIGKFPKSKILVFWGQRGNKFLNCLDLKYMSKLKEMIIKSNSAYYTCQKKFVHPSRAKNTFSIEALQNESILD